MQLQLKKISLINFKGVQNRVIEFGGETEIRGKNATGKTTVFDAFTWCLFGKDSADRSDFNVKPLDANNQPLRQTDNEVTALIVVDDRLIEFKRIYHENWVKKTGELETSFSGDTTQLFINDVPKKVGEYKAEVSAILDEKLFKLITNPLYFNEQMKWQDRRNVLISIAGEVDDQELIAKNGSFARVVELLNSKTADDLKKEYAAKKKRLKDELAQIPTRVDELNRSKPENELWGEIRKEIDGCKVKIDTIDAQIEDKSKAHESTRTLQRNISDRNITLEMIATNITENENELLEMRKEWQTINASELTFDPDTFVCPTCTQPLPTDQIEDRKTSMLTNFNANKANKKAKLVEKSDRIKENNTKNTARKIELETQNEADQKSIEHNGLMKSSLKTQIETLAKPETVSVELLLSDDANYKELSAKIVKLENETAIIPPIDRYKSKLQNEEVIKKTNERIAELNAQEGVFAQQLADIEMIEFELINYQRARITEVENRVNSLFGIVQFKMFEELNNGAESEICETLINGVPFADANNAAKINAGVGIINTLCRHYNATAPIFIDNAEAVNRVIDSESQIIKLIVTEDNELTIKNN